MHTNLNTLKMILLYCENNMFNTGLFPIALQLIIIKCDSNIQYDI